MNEVKRCVLVQALMSPVIYNFVVVVIVKLFKCFADIFFNFYFYLFV